MPAPGGSTSAGGRSAAKPPRRKSTPAPPIFKTALKVQAKSVAANKAALKKAKHTPRGDRPESPRARVKRLAYTGSKQYAKTLQETKNITVDQANQRAIETRSPTEAASTYLKARGIKATHIEPVKGRPDRVLYKTNGKVNIIKVTKGRATDQGDAVKQMMTEAKGKKDALHEGGLKVLEFVSKPRYAVGGVLSGHTPGYGIRHRVNPGRVLAKHLPKPIRGTAAFVGDVALDPTTYVGAGLVGKAAKAGSAESKAIRSAAKAESQATAAKMVKAGASQKEIEHVTKGIERRAAVKAEAHRIDRSGPRGVKVTMAGKEVPGVRHATATANVAARKATGTAAKAPLIRTKVAPKLRSTKAFARDRVAMVRPSIRPADEIAAGTTRGQHFGLRVEEAERRGAEARTIHEHDLLMSGIKTRLKAHSDNIERDQQLIADAIERGKIHELPPDLGKIAQDIKEKFNADAVLRDLAHIKEGRIGPRPPVDVVAPTKVAYKAGNRRLRTAKNLGRARSELRAAEKELRDANHTLGIARGRAATQSRSVGGRRAENAAERANKPNFEAGGYGVELANERVGRALVRRDVAVKRVEAATQQHGEAKVTRHEALAAKRGAIREAARRQGEPVNYYPHVPTGKLLEHHKLADSEANLHLANVKFPPGKTVRGSQRRKYNQPISELPEHNFSTDAPLLVHAYGVDTGRKLAASEFYQGAHNLGRPIKDHAELQPGEAVYRLGHDNNRYGLWEVKDHEAIPAGAVALPRAALDRSITSSRATWDTGVWDAATNRWKIAATATPGFHLRNMFGDTWMWHTMRSREGGVASAPPEIRAAWKGVSALAKAEGKVRHGEAVDLLTIPRGTIVRIKKNPDIAPNGMIDLADLVRLAHDHGILRTGHIGGELQDARRFAAGGGGAVGRATGKAFAPMRRWGQNREDLMRFASFKNALDQGMHPTLAAQRARDVHFDYRELTNFERQMKRYAAPFYTFTGRSIPQQVGVLASRPGKFSNLESAREEIAQEFGMTPDEMDYGLTRLQEKMIPIRVHIAGDRAVSFDLPAQALNNLPTGADGAHVGRALLSQLDTLTQLLHPAPKIALEQAFHKTSYNLKEMQGKVDAPSWVGKMPGFMKDALGVEPKYDKPPESGGKQIGWVWSGRTGAAISGSVPGGPGAALRATTPTPANTSLLDQLISPAFGIREKKVQSASSAQMSGISAKRKSLETRQKELESSGLYGSTQYLKNRQEIDRLKLAQRRYYYDREHPSTDTTAGPPAPTGASPYGSVVPAQAKSATVPAATTPAKGSSPYGTVVPKR